MVWFKSSAVLRLGEHHCKSTGPYSLMTEQVVCQRLQQRHVSPLPKNMTVSVLQQLIPDLHHQI